MAGVQIKETFRSSMNEQDLMTGDVAVLAGIPTRIGEYKIEAGQVIKMGFGEYKSMQDAVGRIYADIKDSTNAVVSGKLRFSVWTPQNRLIEVLAEFDIDTINDNLSDPTKRQPLSGTDFPYMSEDKRFVVEVITRVDKTISKTNSRILFDTTEGVV